MAGVPLGSASRYPRPLSVRESPAALAILKASSAAVSLRPLPKGLVGLPISFKAINAPAQGFALEVEPPPVLQEARFKAPAVKAKMPGTVKKISKTKQKVKAQRAVTRLRKRAAQWVSAAYDFIFK